MYDYSDDIRHSMHFILLYTTVGDAVSSNDMRSRFLVIEDIIYMYIRAEAINAAGFVSNVLDVVFISYRCILLFFFRGENSF